MLSQSPVIKARPEHKDEILEVCRENHSENGSFSLSFPKVEAMVTAILEGSKGVIGVIRPQGQIESIIMMQIGQFFYTDDWCLEELMNYVRPQFRRSTNAKEMIKFAKRCSDEIGIPLVIGVTSNVKTQAKIDLYEREIGPLWGGYFIYNLKDPPVQPGFTALMPRDLRETIDRVIKCWEEGRPLFSVWDDVRPLPLPVKEEIDRKFMGGGKPLPVDVKRDISRQLRKWSGRP